MKIGVIVLEMAAAITMVWLVIQAARYLPDWMGCLFAGFAVLSIVLSLMLAITFILRK